MKKEGKDPAELMEKVRQVGQEIKDLDEELKNIENQLEQILLNIPNIPHESVPVGEDDKSNVEIRKWGEPTQFSFAAKAHWVPGWKGL